jgi:hypothetical protein
VERARRAGLAPGVGPKRPARSGGLEREGEQCGPEEIEQRAGPGCWAYLARGGRGR